MKTLLFTFLLFLSSCAYKQGNYTVKTFENGVAKSYDASAVIVSDELNKIKFKDANGTHTFTGSFELYKK